LEKPHPWSHREGRFLVGADDKNCHGFEGEVTPGFGSRNPPEKKSQHARGEGRALDPTAATSRGFLEESEPLMGLLKATCQSRRRRQAEGRES